MILKVILSIIGLLVIYFCICYNHSDRKTTLRQWVIGGMFSFSLFYVLWLT